MTSIINLYNSIINFFSNKRNTSFFKLSRKKYFTFLCLENSKNTVSNFIQLKPNKIHQFKEPYCFLTGFIFKENNPYYLYVKEFNQEVSYFDDYNSLVNFIANIYNNNKTVDILSTIIDNSRPIIYDKEYNTFMVLDTYKFIDDVLHVIENDYKHIMDNTLEYFSKMIGKYKEAFVVCSDGETFHITKKENQIFFFSKEYEILFKTKLLFYANNFVGMLVRVITDALVNKEHVFELYGMFIVNKDETVVIDTISANNVAKSIETYNRNEYYCDLDGERICSDDYIDKLI